MLAGPPCTRTLLDLEVPSRGTLFGGRLRRLCCTVSRPRTVVSDCSSSLSSAARAVVEPPRPTAAVPPELSAPVGGQRGGGELPRRGRPRAPRWSCAPRRARGGAASPPPRRSPAHGRRDLCAPSSPEPAAARCSSVCGSGPSASGGAAAQPGRSARCGCSRAPRSRRCTVPEVYARRFGTARRRAARVPTRSSGAFGFICGSICRPTAPTAAAPWSRLSRAGSGAGGSAGQPASLGTTPRRRSPAPRSASGATSTASTSRRPLCRTRGSQGSSTCTARAPAWAPTPCSAPC